MPHLAFTANLRQHVACPEADVDGRTVADALAAYFANHPQVRGYILDEHGYCVNTSPSSSTVKQSTTVKLLAIRFSPTPRSG